MTKTAAEFIAGFEGFAQRAYWDVNAFRLGYGSDTEGPDQIPVTQGMTTTKERALQNLALRIPKFQFEAIHGKTGMGAATWEKLNADQQIAITSLVYNYGRLPKRVVVIPGDPKATSDSIRVLQGDNGGVNHKRRNAEADFYLAGAATPIVPLPQIPVPQVPLPVPSLPTAPAGLPPISASAAGRRAAVLDNLEAMRTAYLEERAAIDRELAVLETTIADFGKLAALPAPPLLQKPVAAPAAQPEGSTMPNIVTLILKNWITSALGTAAATPALLDILGGLSGDVIDWKKDLPLLAVMILGWVAKDANVTGGTVPATDEAKRRIG